MNTINLTVKGRVQGVFFRAFTQKQAIKLGVLGYVKNNDDGTVKIIACAKQKTLDEFIRGCHKGPIMAKVNQIDIQKITSAQGFTQFEIR